MDFTDLANIIYLKLPLLILTFFLGLSAIYFPQIYIDNFLNFLTNEAKTEKDVIAIGKTTVYLNLILYFFVIFVLNGIWIKILLILICCCFIILKRNKNVKNFFSKK